MIDKALIHTALSCKCPRCGKGDLFPTRFSLTFKDKCDACNLDIGRNDTADGPAVFLIFILGFTIVPLALITELKFEPPVWVHIVLWLPLTIFAIIAMLRPAKAYVLALQLKHRPKDLE